MSRPYGQIGRRKSSPFSVPVQTKPVIPPPEASMWFWNPNRVGAGPAPAWFQAKLRDLDPNLACTWSHYHERWLIWTRNWRIAQPICSGWMLLFPVQYTTGDYMPLDNRVFARLYAASTDQWGNARYYFDAVSQEIERDRERAEAKRVDAVRYSAGEYYDYMKIKSIGKGNKFANHFS